MAGVTINGFVSKTRDELVNELNLSLKTAFGEQFDVSPEGPDGQIIGIMADFMATQWQMAEDAFNSYNPATSSGVSLDNAVRLNDIIRIADKPTEVTVQLSASNGAFDGTVIAAGSIVSTADGIEFTTNNAVVLPGETIATSTTLGAIIINANEVTVVVTEITGWDECDNTNAGTVGIVLETDTELRSRRERSIVRTGRDSLEAIESAIIDLGVESVLIVDNDTAAEVDGVPANSFLTVVNGGLLQEIGQRIFENKPLGTLAFGDNIVIVIDSRGTPHNIGVSRPTVIEIDIELSMAKSVGAVNDANDLVKQAMIDHINGLNMGDNVVWSKLFAPANSIANMIATDIRVAKLGDSLDRVTVPMANIQKPNLLLVNINLIEV